MLNRFIPPVLIPSLLIAVEREFEVAAREAVEEYCREQQEGRA